MNDHDTNRDVQWLARFLTARASLAPALLDGPAFASAVRGRMSHLTITDLAQYAALVEQNEHELHCLASEVAVPETWFFRYPASFEFLRAQLAIRWREQPGTVVGASLGCATGVEAWCMAACALSAGWPKDQIIIHAIDRSPFAIESAREGRIPGGSVRSVFPEWADPWICVRNSSVVISDEVLNCVRFLQADVLTALNLFSQPIHALFCRNVLIYLDATARVLLRDRIAHWVAHDGLVFLGHADGLERGAVFEAAEPPAAFAWRPRVAVLRIDPPKIPRPRIARPISTAPAVRKSAVAPRTPLTLTASIAERVQPMIAAREFNRAQRMVETGLKATPTNIELLELLAGIFCAQNELVRAIQTYERLVYLEPHHGPALLALTELSDALERTDDANRYRARLKRLGDS